MTIHNEFNKHKDPKKAKILARFFKTGKGEYAEGDQFLGIIVPTQRKIANKYKELPTTEIQQLLQSNIHEYRLTALLILIEQFKKKEKQTEIFNMYVKNTQYVNNWDLVDISAPTIVGTYLVKKEKTLLYTFAQSKNMWERRIAILATFSFIKQKQFNDTIKIAGILRNDVHDLIHKAVGWMLREVGKRDQVIEEQFLDKYAATMPRTMLRYAIEKFDEKKRKYYLKLK
ncbi:MAG: DNA alkylation repair protein [Candidatus Woesearchaeota archaeon]|jgi:3-methyladenine DNA glycosylase AlkD